MILQSLYQLYTKLPDIDSPGYAPMGLSWSIVIDVNGQLQSLLPLCQKAERGSKLLPLRNSAPTVGKRSSNDKPGFLADKTDYVFGFDPAKMQNKKAATKLIERFSLFRDSHLAARSKINHSDFDAVCNFLESWDPEDPTNATKISTAASAPISDIIGSNLAFQLNEKIGFVHQLDEVKNYWLLESGKEKETYLDTCLITGKSEIIKLVHPPIKRIYDEPGKPSEKGIVVFQTAKRAFSSYGKDGLQGLNAPISIRAAQGYSSALNWLITNRRISIGDATTVFWTSEPTSSEIIFPWMLSGSSPAEDDGVNKEVMELLLKIKYGGLAQKDLGDPTVPYYILGISPNSSRLSIRFWHTSTLGDLVNNLKLHLDQLKIVRQWDDTNSNRPDPIAPFAKELLRELVPLKDGRRDDSKLPPQLAGAFMNSIITGTRYPDALAIGVMNRIRIIEKKPKGEGALDHVTYLRAAILKAWLMRNNQEWLNQQNIKMTTALEKDNPSIAYQLGRLFAVYEQAQRAAHEFKLERTIRETMFSSACATPLAVFVRLDKLNKYHIQKLKKGTKSFMDNLIDEINQKVRASAPLPSALDLKGQSLFCIGYYHQRHDLRQK